MTPSIVICRNHKDEGCMDGCVHRKPHERDSMATKAEFHHLTEDTLRDCGDGKCCTRGIETVCDNLIGGPT